VCDVALSLAWGIAALSFESLVIYQFRNVVGQGGKDIMLLGGANAAQQYLKAGLLDEIHLHIVPVPLGEGIRLFKNIGIEQIKLERISLTEDSGVTHGADTLHSMRSFARSCSEHRTA